MKTIDALVLAARESKASRDWLFGQKDGEPYSFGMDGARGYQGLEELEKAALQLRDEFGEQVRPFQLGLMIAQSREEAQALEKPFVVVMYGDDSFSLYGPRGPGVRGHDGFADIRDNGLRPFQEFSEAEYNRGEIQRQSGAACHIAHFNLRKT